MYSQKSRIKSSDYLKNDFYQCLRIVYTDPDKNSDSKSKSIKYVLKPGTICNDIFSKNLHYRLVVIRIEYLAQFFNLFFITFS